MLFTPIPTTGSQLPAPAPRLALPDCQRVGQHEQGAADHCPECQGEAQAGGHAPFPSASPHTSLWCWGTSKREQRRGLASQRWAATLKQQTKANHHFRRPKAFQQVGELARALPETPWAGVTRTSRDRTAPDSRPPDPLHVLLLLLVVLLLALQVLLQQHLVLLAQQLDLAQEVVVLLLEVPLETGKQLQHKRRQLARQGPTAGNAAPQRRDRPEGRAKGTRLSTSVAHTWNSGRTEGQPRGCRHPTCGWSERRRTAGVEG